MSRVKQISAIHAIVAKLEWDDTRYRQFLFEHSGEKSCTDMSDAVLNKVYLAAKKLQPDAKKDWRKPRMDKLRAIWALLHDAGVVRDRSENALRNWCRTSAQVDRLEWAQAARLDACVEGLKAWAKREGFGVRYVEEHRHTELFRLGE